MAHPRSGPGTSNAGPRSAPFLEKAIVPALVSRLQPMTSFRPASAPDLNKIYEPLTQRR